jgi:hypothetical protein
MQAMVLRVAVLGKGRYHGNSAKPHQSSTSDGLFKLQGAN